MTKTLSAYAVIGLLIAIEALLSASTLFSFGLSEGWDTSYAFNKAANGFLWRVFLLEIPILIGILYYLRHSAKLWFWFPLATFFLSLLRNMVLNDFDLSLVLFNMAPWNSAGLGRNFNVFFNACLASALVFFALKIRVKPSEGSR